MPALDLLKEGARQMTICNACRYCEGYCAVFPAMEQRRIFTKADLTYLANLCFDCRDCYYACQYAPPHEFAVNVPKLMSELRADTYREFTWPALLAGVFKHNHSGGRRHHGCVHDDHPRPRAGIPRFPGIVRRSSRRRRVLSSRSIHRHDRAAVVDRALRFGGFYDWRDSILARDPRERSRAYRFCRALARYQRRLRLGLHERRRRRLQLSGGEFLSVEVVVAPCGFLRLSARLGRDHDRRVLRSFSRLAGALSLFQRAGGSRHGWRHHVGCRHDRSALFEMAKRPRSGACEHVQHGRGVSAACCF